MKTNSVYKILLLEDDTNLAEMQSEFLKKDKYSINKAHSISEFRKKIKEDEYMMIISDICLPDGNGIDIIEELKKTDNKTPVVFQSGTLNDEITKKAYEIGAIAVIPKPFTMEHIRDIIQKFELYEMIELNNPLLAKMVLKTIKHAA